MLDWHWECKKSTSRLFFYKLIISVNVQCIDNLALCCRLPFCWHSPTVWIYTENGKLIAIVGRFYVQDVFSTKYDNHLHCLPTDFSIKQLSIDNGNTSGTPHILFNKLAFWSTMICILWQHQCHYDSFCSVSCSYWCRNCFLSSCCISSVVIDNFVDRSRRRCLTRLCWWTLDSGRRLQRPIMTVTYSKM